MDRRQAFPVALVKARLAAGTTLRPSSVQVSEAYVSCVAMAIVVPVLVGEWFSELFDQGVLAVPQLPTVRTRGAAFTAF